MATITVPIAATQQEIRCDAFICRNALDVSESDPLNKYSAFIDRVAEPQDATGAQVGVRNRLDPVRLDLAALMAESFTAGGVTVTGAQLLALINAAIDAHKAEGMTP
jgi:hypothetical protein